MEEEEEEEEEEDKEEDDDDSKEDVKEDDEEDLFGNTSLALLGNCPNFDVEAATTEERREKFAFNIAICSLAAVSVSLT